MNLCEHLTITARHLPDTVALVWGERRYTYAELATLSAQAAGRLDAFGVTRGDRVALMLPNCPAFVVWYYAVLRLGAMPVSISPRFAAAEVNHIVTDCDVRAFIATPGVAPEELPPFVRASHVVDELGEPLIEENSLAQAKPLEGWIDSEPDEAAVLLYTSGTTGFAKGATLSHRNVRSNVEAFNHLCGVKPGERLLLTVPLFHCFGQNALLNSAMNAGATLVMQRAFDPNETRDHIQRHAITQLYGVPTMFQMLHDRCDPADLASITYCFSAAAKLPEGVSRQWLSKFGLPIHEGYGLTETSPFASYNHRLRYKLGTIGRPIDGVEMRVVESVTGEPMPPGELGEIVIRGPNVMLGYWNQPEQTARSIRSGWFFSGDIGRIDEDGYFTIVDRVKDMISVGGLKVFPAEVERVLAEHPGVSEPAVIGVPDDTFGEQVAAFLVAKEPRASRLIKDLNELCRERLAGYKNPKQYHLLDELPRNPSGKILKRRLRELLAVPDAKGTTEPMPGGVTQPSAEFSPFMQSLHAAYPSERPGVALAQIQAALSDIDPSSEPPEREASLLEAGLDSLTLVELSARLQQMLGPDREVPATLVFDHPSLSELADWLVQQANESPAESVGEGVDDQLIDATQPESALLTRGVSTEQLEEVAAMSEEAATLELMRELEDES